MEGATVSNVFYIIGNINDDANALSHAVAENNPSESDLRTVFDTWPEALLQQFR